MISPKRAAFTLIELLVVTAIISIILGIGSGLLTHFDHRLLLRATAGQVATLVRVAQNFARQEKNGAWIKIAQDKSWLEVWGGRLTGCWHGEDLVSTGALGQDAALVSISLMPGKIGNSLEFQFGKSKMDCGWWNRLRTVGGFSLSCWIYPYRCPTGERQIICQAGAQCSVGLTPDYLVYLEVAGQRAVTTYAPPLYQWSYLELHSDATTTVMLANHFKVLSQPPLNAPSEDRSLLWGSAFHGRLDELRVGTPVPLETLLLPQGITLSAAPSYIVFDRDGQLDPQSHAGPQRLVFAGKVSQRLQTVTVHISRMGDVDVTE